MTEDLNRLRRLTLFYRRTTEVGEARFAQLKAKVSNAHRFRAELLAYSSRTMSCSEWHEVQKKLNRTAQEIVSLEIECRDAEARLKKSRRVARLAEEQLAEAGNVWRRYNDGKNLASIIEAGLLISNEAARGKPEEA